MLAIFLLARGTSAGGTRVVRESPVAFNVLQPDAMREVEPAAGELLHLQRKGLDDFIVMPLNLPEYEGERSGDEAAGRDRIGGVLPVQAARELDALRERFPNLEPVEEGKARINQVAGYSLVFRASRRPRLYGRLTMLPQPGTREGVKLLMLANPDAGADKARDVGARGELKIPYRSFRFGTEGP